MLYLLLLCAACALNRGTTAVVGRSCLVLSGLVWSGPVWSAGDWLQAMRDTRDVVGHDADSAALFDCAHAAASELAQATRSPVCVGNALRLACSCEGGSFGGQEPLWFPCDSGKRIGPTSIPQSPTGPFHVLPNVRTPVRLLCCRLPVCAFATACHSTRGWLAGWVFADDGWMDGWTCGPMGGGWAGARAGGSW